LSNYLEDWSNVIKSSNEQEREGVKKWFDIHKPIAEFAILREEEYINYGVWDFEEDFIIMFKNPNGQYNFRARMIYDKQLLQKLKEIL
jgi:hypothetical protein